MTARRQTRWSIVLLLTSLAVVVLIGVVLAMASGLPNTGQPASSPTTPKDQSLSPGPPTVEPDYVATHNAIMTAVPEVTAARPTGIYDAGAEFYHEGFRMQNAWQGLVDGYWANVVAGTHSSDPEQGVIFSRWEFPNAAIGSFFNIPVRAGSVRIVAEQDARLTLEAADGTVFYWDIPSQSFVASPEAVAATITPPPTHTPTATLRPAPTGYPAPGTPPPGTGYPGRGYDPLSMTEDAAPPRLYVHRNHFEGRLVPLAGVEELIEAIAKQVPSNPK